MTTSSPAVTELPMSDWAIPDRVALPKDTLRMRLDIYQDSIILNSYIGHTVHTRMISANDAASALTQHMGITTGLLPEAALWINTSAQGRTTAIWQPPATWQVALQENPLDHPLRLALPMPGLVFVCPQSRPPWVFAAKAKPASPTDQLFHAPAFNVFRDGRVCPGTHSFPEDPSQVPISFFRSFFSPTADTHGRSKKHPTDLKKLWTNLNGKRKYPLADLLPSITVAQAMQLPHGPGET